jgi:glycosyltransferase 2 family protein
MALRTAAARAGRPVLIVAGVGVIGYLVYEVGPRAVWDSIRPLGWRLPIVLVLPFAAAVVLDTLGWRILLRDHRVPLGVLLRARLAGEAVNLMTPTASVGGEPLKAYLLRPYVPLAEGFASVVVDKTTVVAGQTVLLLAGLVLAASMLPLASPLMLVMASLFVVEVVAMSGFVLVQMRGVFGGGGRVLGRMGLAPSARYQEGLNTLDRRLGDFYRERRGRLVASALLHAAAWATGGIEIYLVLVFLGVGSSLVTALVIDAFGAAVKFASFMIPASLGALEGGYVAIFGALGFGAALGLSYTLIRRLREVLWAAVGLLWLSSLRARPWLGPEDTPDPAPGECP